MHRLLAIVGIVVLAAAASGAYFLFDRTPEGPDQPIAFFHSVHAGQNQIPCMYCHTTAESSPSAGIPAVQVCVGCHVPGSANLPPEEAQLAFPTAQRDTFWNRQATQLVDYWKSGEPIPWVKVHDLPDYVHFPHFMHINAGLECQTCHGPVQEMEKVYQFSSLQMGWCVDCHTGKTAISPAEEAAVQERSSYVKKLAALEAAGSNIAGQQARWPNQRASVDCFVCHY
jgi:hypothetical protein